MKQENEKKQKTGASAQNDVAGGSLDALERLRYKGVGREKGSKVKKEPREVVKREEKGVDEVEWAYEIEDCTFGTFRPRKTDNGWWGDMGKVQRLIDVFKFDASIEESIAYAGITYEQLIYFREVHPEFSQIESTCRELQNLAARQTLVGQIKTDGNLAFKYLERKKPAEFAPKPPVLGVQINIQARVAAMRDRFRVKEIEVKTTQ